MLSIAGLAAPVPVVGVATARGGFLIDHSPVTRTGTILSGAILETQQASSVVQLRVGGQVNLAPGARAKMYGDHLVLERGAAQLQNKASYLIETGNLEVQPSGAGAVSVVVGNNNAIEIRALQGEIRVSTKAGLLLASMKPGMALSFSAQGSAAAPSLATVTGPLRKAGNSYVITDATTNLVFQLTGCNTVNKEVGSFVQVTGRIVPGAVAAGSGASQSLQVSCDQVAGAPSEATGPEFRVNNAPAGSPSHNAVIGGLAIAAVGAGAGLAVELVKTEAASPNQ